MDGWITLGAELDTKSFDAQIEDVESKLATLEQRWEETNNMPAFEGKNEDLQNLSLQIEKLSNKLIILKKKQQDVNNQGLENLGNNVSKIGDGMSSILKKVAKWGLALFSVRTAYSLIRNAITTISESNDQMKANIDYMRFALAMSLKPIVEWLVNAVYKLMTYINYISNAWFGYNLFKDAGIEDFEKSLEKSNKTAKDLKKTLMGFDEANVIQDTSSASGGGTTALPSFDLSKVEQIDVPDWVKWIADNKDTIIQLAEIVGIAFGIGKVTSILSNIAKLFGMAGPTAGIGGKGLMGLFSSLSALAVISSIVVTITIAKYVWDDLHRAYDELVELNKQANEYHDKWEKNLDPVKDVGTEVNTINVNLTDAEKTMQNSRKEWSWLLGINKQMSEISEQNADHNGTTLNKIKEMYWYEGRTLQEKQDLLSTLKRQWEYNLEIGAQMTAQHKDATQLKKINLETFQEIKRMELDIEKTREEGRKKNQQAWDNLKTKALDTLQKIKDFKIGDKEVGIKVTIGDALKKLGDVIANLGVVQTLKDGLNNVKTNVINPIKSTFNSIKNVLKPMATGGIVNLPNKGVPLGGALVGEAGREGVIPLTDPNTMATLGQEIGKWVNISLQNNMVVDGRVLATATNNQINKERLLMNR